MKCYPQVKKQPSYGHSSYPLVKSCRLGKKSWKWCSRVPKAANPPWKKQSLFSHAVKFSPQNLLACGELPCCSWSQFVAVPELWINDWWERVLGKYCCCLPSCYTLPSTTAASCCQWQVTDLTRPFISSGTAVLNFWSVHFNIHIPVFFSRWLNQLKETFGTYIKSVFDPH